jgi:thymidylate synthase (FAD)
MILVNPTHEIMSIINGNEILNHIERCGRTCYKSEDKITSESGIKFVRGIVKSGHHSVIEHFNITVRVICDRGVSHELVRHRLAAYSQESTRYCNYNNDKFDNQLTIIKPDWTLLEPGNYTFDDLNKIIDTATRIWLQSMLQSENNYKDLISEGWTPDKARSVLPNALKTEVVMTANLREWRHVLNLRCSKPAHRQIREIMMPLLKELHHQIPGVFDDIYEKYAINK